MALVVLTVAGGILVGYLRGGRLANLARARLAWTGLLAVAVGAQGVLAVVAAAGGSVEAVALPLLAASQIALLGFLLVNRHLPGSFLVFTGFALNAAVILANGAMPVAREALLAVSAQPHAVAPGKHRLLTEDDRLVWLADIIPLPLLRTIVSVGDVVLAAGIGLLVVALMTDHPPPAGRRSRGHLGDLDERPSAPHDVATQPPQTGF